MYDIIQIISEWVINNPYKTIGTAIGFLSALLIVIFGFPKTLFILFFTLAALFLGKFFDDGLTIRVLSNQVKRLRKNSGKKNSAVSESYMENEIPVESNGMHETGDVDLDDIL